MQSRTPAQAKQHTHEMNINATELDGHVSFCATVIFSAKERSPHISCMTMQWQLSSGTPLFWGHLHSGDINFGPEKLNVPIIFVLVTSNKGTPPFLIYPEGVP